jgi:hypothetical protein
MFTDSTYKSITAEVIKLHISHCLDSEIIFDCNLLNTISKTFKMKVVDLNQVYILLPNTFMSVDPFFEKTRPKGTKIKFS